MKSLGLLEITGVTAAVTALDIMCKTADVEFVTWERKLGGRLVTIIVQGEVAAVSVFHVVHLDILVVNRQVAALLEADAVKLACKAEHRIDAGVEREVWLEDFITYAIEAAQLLF